MFVRPSAVQVKSSDSDDFLHCAGRRRGKCARGHIAILAAALVALSGCADPRTGRLDPLRTGLFGAGVGGGVGVLGGLIGRDQQYRRYAPRSYGHSGFGSGYQPYYGGGSYLPPITSPRGVYGYGRQGYGW